jgi:transcriptional regulator with XRE-family HTH domain
MSKRSLHTLHSKKTLGKSGSKSLSKNKLGDIGSLLKDGRISKGLSQGQVASLLKLNSAQSISDWERNYGSGVPLNALRKLIKLYGLETETVFDTLLEYQFLRLKKDLKKRFYK